MPFGNCFFCEPPNSMEVLILFARIGRSDFQTIFM